MRVILLEFIDEAKVILEKFGADFFIAKDTLAICLHPKVRVFLREKGIDSKDTLDYLDNNAQDRIVLKTEELTIGSMEQLRLRDAFGIEKGYAETCILHFRFYLNHFFWIIEILKAIKKKHSVNEICCCLPKNNKIICAKNPYTQNEERFLGFLARDFCNANSIKFFAVKHSLASHDLIVNIAASAIRFVTALITLTGYLLLICSNSRKEKRVIVPALSYRMDILLKEVKSRDPDIRCIMVLEGKATLRQETSKLYLILSNTIKKIIKENVADDVFFLDLLGKFFIKDVFVQKDFDHQINKLVSYIEASENGIFIYEGVSVSPYLNSKVSLGLKREVLSLQHTTKVLNALFKKLKPRLLLSMYSVGIYYMMGELSHILGFSSLDISHGTHVPPNNKYEKIENYRLAASVILNTYKHVAVQTPWAERFLNYYGDDRPRVFSGPLIYSNKNKDAGERIRREILGLKNDEKVIVHATTQKLRNSMRFHIEETLDEYISSLADIVGLVNSLDEAWLIIRPHPVCDISKDEFLKLLPHCEKLSIMNKGPFSDVLSVADVLISYSSTCIEEALQNSIPVILYDKWKRYNHFNIPETKALEGVVKKPVYYVSSSATLKECMPRILAVFGSSVLSDSDLKDYRYPQNYRLNFNDFVNKALN